MELPSLSSWKKKKKKRKETLQRALSTLMESQELQNDARTLDRTELRLNWGRYWSDPLEKFWISWHCGRKCFCHGNSWLQRHSKSRNKVKIIQQKNGCLTDGSVKCGSRWKKCIWEENNRLLNWTSVYFWDNRKSNSVRVKEPSFNDVEKRNSATFVFLQ